MSEERNSQLVEGIFRAMRKKAKQFGLGGHAAVSVVGEDLSEPQITVEAIGRIDPDDETDHRASVLAKITEMVSTSRPSGKLDRPKKVGELNRDEGLLAVRESGERVFVAFDSNNPVHDREVAKVGLMSAGFGRAHVEEAISTPEKARIPI